jgi:hypothetical protein
MTVINALLSLYFEVMLASTIFLLHIVVGIGGGECTMGLNILEELQYSWIFQNNFTNPKNFPRTRGSSQNQPQKNQKDPMKYNKSSSFSNPISLNGSTTDNPSKKIFLPYFFILLIIISL